MRESRTGESFAAGPAGGLRLDSCAGEGRRPSQPSIRDRVEVGRGALQSGEESDDVSFMVGIPPGQVLPPGRYVSNLRVLILEAGESQEKAVSSQSFTLSVPVLEVTE